MQRPEDNVSQQLGLDVSDAFGLVSPASMSPVCQVWHVSQGFSGLSCLIGLSWTARIDESGFPFPPSADASCLGVFCLGCLVCPVCLVRLPLIGLP